MQKILSNSAKKSSKLWLKLLIGFVLVVSTALAAATWYQFKEKAKIDSELQHRWKDMILSFDVRFTKIITFMPIVKGYVTRSDMPDLKKVNWDIVIEGLEKNLNSLQDNKDFSDRKFRDFWYVNQNNEYLHLQRELGFYQQQLIDLIKKQPDLMEQQLYNYTIIDWETEQSKLLAYAKEINLLIDNYKKVYEKRPLYWGITWFVPEENFPKIIIVP